MEIKRFGGLNKHQNFDKYRQFPYRHHPFHHKLTNHCHKTWSEKNTARDIDK